MENEARGSEQTAATGAFGFFRKYQKLILYTAGLFTLLTFSITGALMGLTDTLFGEALNYGTLEIEGRVVEVTAEDYSVARELHNKAGAAPAVVLPSLGVEEDNGEGHVDLLAMLRRITIEMGLEVSSVEVERAIDQVVQQENSLGNPITATDLARGGGYPSLSAYRTLVAEAMRIGNYMRLEALAADTSDAAMASDLVEQGAKISLKFAKLDKAAIQEQLEEEGASDEDLQTWLDELDDGDKFRFQDTNQVSLLLAAAIYGDFEREQFTEELAEVSVSDVQLQQIYDRDRESRWTTVKEEDKEEEDKEEEDEEADREEGADATGEGAPPNSEARGNEDARETEEEAERRAQEEEAQEKETQEPGPPLPPSPYQAFAEVKDEIQGMYEAEQVLQGFWRKVQDARTDHLAAAQELRDTALRANSTAQLERDAAQEALDADPDSAELKEALETAEADVEAKTTALDEAEMGMDTARSSFDMRAVFEEVVAGRPGFKVVEVEGPDGGPTNAEGLNPLPTPLGKWTDTFAATSMSGNGDLSSLIQRADGGAFHFKVTDFVLRPLKPLADIVEEVETGYFTAKADEQAQEKGEAFEAALLRLGKKQIAERISELETEKASKMEERLTSWREQTQTGLEEAETSRDGIPPNRRAHQLFAELVVELQEALGKEEEKREELQTALDEETDETIATEARDVYEDVLEVAAEEVGFEIQTLPAYSRQLSFDDPRFEYRYSDDVKYLFRDPTAQALEEGEITELLDDITGRALYMAACIAEEDITIDDLTRRRLLEYRYGFGFGFPQVRLSQTYFQSFAADALKQRFNWQPAVEPEVADSASAAAGK